MTKNYLTIALRNLRRQAGYAGLNVAGLAVGIAACVLILLFVRDERAYDRFHENAGRIYRVVAGNGEDGQPTNANGAYAWAPALRVEFGDVEQAVRFHKMGWGEQRLVAHGERRFYERGFFFADAEVFDVFTFPFVEGDPATALVAPGSVVVTREVARRYFGSESAMGRTLTIDPFNDGRPVDFRVTGVLEDVPAHSHLQFGLLGSWSTQDPARVDGWGFDPVFTYVLLRDGAKPAGLAAQLPGFVERHLGEDAWYTLSLQPILDIHLRSHLRAELEPGGDVAYVYVFSAIALLILVIACVNFTNLATARAARRAREIGMRKVLGAHRPQLVRQFLGEAVVLSTLATVLAVGLVAALLPVFNAVSGKALTFGSLATPAVAGGLAATALLVGLAAGSYPALVLSGFRPVDVLKGRVRGAVRGAGLRRGLVVFQFGVSIFLLACTAVVFEQVDFIRSKNLGFARDQVLVLPLNDALRAALPAFQAALRSEPAIRRSAASEQVPGRAGNGANYLVEGLDEATGFHRLFAGVGFFETYGIEMAAGRAFSEAMATDTSEAFVVNETFVREMGWSGPEAALDREVQMWWNGIHRTGRIVGVARDFHLFSLRDAVTPLVTTVMQPEHLNFVSVRVDAARARDALAGVEAVWSRFAPGYPFDYYFVDADFERLHRADLRLGQVFRYFAALAILVACLGLFGLAAFTAEQRTKEIGVRKVMGATVPGLVVLLAKDFTRLVGVAFVVAAPVAFLAMEQWLAHFAFRIDVTAAPFVLAGLAALALALATVSYQSVRAALTDPVKALRHE